MDLTNLNNYSTNIEDRRNEGAQYPSRGAMLLSLLKGLMKPSPPPLNRVETWNGDPNMQYGDTKLPPLGSNKLQEYVNAARPVTANILGNGGSLMQPQQQPQQQEDPALVQKFLSMFQGR